MLRGLAHSFDAFVVFWNRASQFLFEWKPFNSFFNSQNPWISGVAELFELLLQAFPVVTVDYLVSLNGFELTVCGLASFVVLGSTVFAIASLISKITDIFA